MAPGLLGVLAGMAAWSEALGTPLADHFSNQVQRGLYAHAATQSYSFSYSFSYSTSYGGGGRCGESCPEEVRAAYEADDFGTFCHLDLSCFDACPSTGTNDLYYAAICTCDWGTVQGGFVNFLLGNPDGPYCCSSQACNDAILAYEANINLHYADDLVPFMASVCADPAKSEACVDSGAFYTCGASCPSSVKDAYEAGDGAVFCALDYSCLADCGDDMVNYYDAYCGCGEQSNYGGDFVPYQPWDYGDFYSTAPGSLYCCGAPACKAAITNLYTPAWAAKLPTMCDAVTCAPTAVPTPGPTVSRRPTPGPSLAPSRSPTLGPTTLDTVAVAVSLRLTKAAAPAPTDAAELKTTVADELGVAEHALHGFTLTSSVTARRTLHSSSSMRNLLAIYTWVCSFELVESLAVSGAASSAALVASVAATLASSTFTAMVAASVGADLDAGSVTASDITRRPPTSQPSPGAGSDGDGGDDDGWDVDVPGGEMIMAGAFMAMMMLVAACIGGAIVCRGRDVGGGEGPGVDASSEPASLDALHVQLQLKDLGASGGGCMDFLHEAGLSTNRAASLSLRMAEQGFEDPAAFAALSDDELDDALLRTQLGLMPPEARKFRAAVRALREEKAAEKLATQASKRRRPLSAPMGGDAGNGGGRGAGVGRGGGRGTGRGGGRGSSRRASLEARADAECGAFLANLCLPEGTLARVKAAVAESHEAPLALDDLCDPGIVSDEVLRDDAELNKTQVRRFRRAIRERNQAAEQDHSTSL